MSSGRVITNIWVFPKIIGTTQIGYFNRVFHYKPSILGYPYFWKHPYPTLWNAHDAPVVLAQIVAIEEPSETPAVNGHTVGELKKS